MLVKQNLSPALFTKSFFPKGKGEYFAVSHPTFPTWQKSELSLRLGEKLKVKRKGMGKGTGRGNGKARGKGKGRKKRWER